MIKTNKTFILDLSNPNKRQCVPFCLLGDRTAKIWYRPYYRKAWIPRYIYDVSNGYPNNSSEYNPLYLKRYGSCNLAFTLNADCRCDWDVHNKKTSNDILFKILDNLIKNKVIQKITCVYEYGKGGKEAGKLHYHGIVKFFSSTEKNNREIFEKEILKVFNKNLQLKHRTLHTKIFKTVLDRERYIEYMKKEPQNYYKNLFSI